MFDLNKIDSEVNDNNNDIGNQDEFSNIHNSSIQ